MTEPDLYTLTRRLERLERESRRGKAVVSVLAPCWETPAGASWLPT